MYSSSFSIISGHLLYLFKNNFDFEVVIFTESRWPIWLSFNRVLVLKRAVNRQPGFRSNTRRAGKYFYVFFCVVLFFFVVFYFLLLLLFKTYLIFLLCVFMFTKIHKEILKITLFEIYETE